MTNFPWPAVADAVYSGREDQTLELKQTLDLTDRPSRAEIARDIAAMANREGGYIVVGVVDARHRASPDLHAAVTGWSGDVDETERQLRTILTDFCDPPPRIDVSAFLEPHTSRTLLVIHVHRSHARPHAISRSSGSIQRHEIWVRDGSMVRIATREEIEEMIRAQRRVLVVNFSHPLTDEQKEQVRLLMGARIDEVISVPVQFSHEKDFHTQAVRYVDQVGLTSHQWQTRDILIILPGFSPAAAAILAELHGRMGHFPNILRLRPSHAQAGTQYEVAEIMNLQSIRDQARSRR